MTSKVQQDRWRGLPVFDAVGHKFHLTSRELRMVAPDKYVFLYDFLGAAILVLADVHGYRETLGPVMAVVLWYGMILLVTALYHVFLLLALLLSKKRPKFFLYLPLVGFASLSIGTFIVNFFYALLMGEPYTFEMATRHMFFNVAMGVLFETIFMLFVFPKVMLRIAPEEFLPVQETPAPPPPRILSIAGRSFPVGDIISISSQDHYLEIVTRAATELLRGRMADVLGQLTESDGISPHRSHWVARNAIDRIGGKSGAKTLLLHNNTEIPIARARVADVQAWLAG